MSSSNTLSCDVLVVGSGPAGAAAAKFLAEKGHRVVLLDRKPFPREKVCGDALLPDAMNALAKLGLRDRVARIAHKTEGISLFSPGGMEARFRCEHYSLRRELLDGILHDAAIEAGAQAITAEAHMIADEGQGVRATMRSGEQIQARTCILATGVNQHLLGPDRPRSPPSGIGSRCYVRSRHGLDRQILIYDRDLAPAYAWIFPLGDGLFNVGVGSVFRAKGCPSYKIVFERLMTRFPLAKALLNEGAVVSPLRSAPLRCGLELASLRPGRWCLAAGELAATTYPASGEGIGKALETGQLAAEAVDRFLAGDERGLDSYELAVGATLASKYRAYKVAQGVFARPWLLGLAIWRFRHSRWLTRRLESVLREEDDPQRMLSPGSLLMSFLR